MDKSWMKLSRTSKEYKKGLGGFLDFAFCNSSRDGMILCPCRKCKNGISLRRDDVEVHLRCTGFMNGYTQWIAHGEHTPHREKNSSMTSNFSHGVPNEGGGMESLLNDAFGIPEDQADFRGQRPNYEAEKFYKLVEDSQQELYPGCSKFSKLSFLVRLLHLKCIGKMSNKAFTMLLELLREAFPVELPKSFYEAKKVIRELGLGYDKYDACPNDCTLYWGKKLEWKDCKICGETRWETSADDPTGEKRKVSRKLLWHFPLKPRLQRLFMSSKTASFMRWHQEGRTKDGYMRHPSDSPAWQYFDYRHSEFSREPRNVRLGLASDGFNPFKNMNVAHSTWPVILVPYNLPPWMSMKHPYFMLSLLIPGPNAPGNNIDVYMQPLIAELKDLWDVGLTTYDASQRENFQMRAALMWTINDFPGYATLSGWSTKGEFACPVCREHTSSRWLKNGCKQCYMGHRRFLEKDHPFRHDSHSFDGSKEFRDPPPRILGDMAIHQLEGFSIRFGKLINDNPKLPFNWKRKSILFELPYWKDNLVQHNLDVMHITKNVCESVVGTLMNSERSKDNVKSRLDLQEMGIRPELYPLEDESGKVSIPSACFVLNKKEKETFCRTLKRLKVPDGYASNISRCVQLKPPRIFGLKSHDYHILMLQLLPLAIRRSLPKAVRSPLLKLSQYFRELCSKVLHPETLVRWEKDIAVILCQLEKVFPPSFFDVMVHLCVHLATEAKLAGPVFYRWMYPIERYLCTLKSYVRNRARPEGCIAEGYLAEECLSFCSMYLDEDVETRFNRPKRNDDAAVVRPGIDVFASLGRPIGKGDVKPLDAEIIKKAHRYVLFNGGSVTPYIKEHLGIVKQQNSRASKHEIERIHNETFAHWFGQTVGQMPLLDDDPVKRDLILLARGPNTVGIQYQRCLVNGFRFHIKELEHRKKTQNSGVLVNAITSSFSSVKDTNPIAAEMAYYGLLNNIIELDYTGGRQVVLFDCDWVSKGGRLKQDEDGFVLTKFTNVKRHNEPFVLASQASQVFYVDDPFHKGWHVAVTIAARDVYEMDSIDNIDVCLETVGCEQGTRPAETEKFCDV